jgi:hypothetical protein
MFKDILHKQITVFRKDGNILQGFISGIDGDFIKMIELDNEEIIFNKDCIDLIRLKIINLENTEEKVERAERQVVLPQARKVSRREQPYEFLDDENPNYDEKCISSGPDEFSMSMKRTEDDSRYQAPSFIRSTTKDE